MNFKTAVLTSLLVVISISLMLVEAKKPDTKGENGVTLSPENGKGVGGRSSSGCGGCSPSTPHNCNVWIWWQSWVTNTGYSCSNCGRSFKDMADLKCKGFEQSAEDDLDVWVYKNCGVRVDCESVRVQSSNISGRKYKKNRIWPWCDQCRFSDLRYRCTYDHQCHVLHQ